MFLGSKALEIVIGVFFVYLLLSTLTSSINEWIAALVALRARTLRSGITHLLDDPAMSDLAKRFYEHPLIKKLGSSSGREPSYIGAHTFTTVLLDLLPIHDQGTGAQTSLDTFQHLYTA